MQLEGEYFLLSISSNGNLIVSMIKNVNLYKLESYIYSFLSVIGLHF